MYRLYGIPARYVTGYAVKPSDFEMRMGDYGHRRVITDASRPCLAEIFIEDLGWTPVEVTPSGEDYEAYDSGLDMERCRISGRKNNSRWRRSFLPPRRR